MTKDEGYAIVPRWMMKDERFTLNMIAVYLALQSFSGVTGSVFPSVPTLAKRARMAPSTARTTLRLLEEIGVVTTEFRERDGQFTSNRYILLTHDPKDPEALDEEEGVHREPVGGTPADGGGTPGAGAEVTPLKNQEISLSVREVDARKIQRQQQAEDWELFWQLFPKKVGKEAAKRAWLSALKRADAATIVAGLQRLLPSLQARELQYRPNPSTWLNAGSWEDEIVVQSAERRAQTPREPIDPQREWEYR